MLKEEMVFNTSEGDIAGPVTMAVALHRPRSSRIDSQQAGQDDTATATGSQRMIVVGDSDFLSDTYIGAGANLNLGLNIFNWLIGDDDFISVEVKPAADTKLILAETQLVIIGFGFFLIIPIILIVIGFRIWYVRKNR